MSLDEADDGVDAVHAGALARFQHGVGLAHAGAHPQKDAQAAAQFAGRLGLQLLQ